VNPTNLDVHRCIIMPVCAMNHKPHEKTPKDNRKLGTNVPKPPQKKNRKLESKEIWDETKRELGLHHSNEKKFLMQKYKTPKACSQTVRIYLHG
jgi:hypothetical protein